MKTPLEHRTKIFNDAVNEGMSFAIPAFLNRNNACGRDVDQKLLKTYAEIIYADYFSEQETQFKSPFEQPVSSDLGPDISECATACNLLFNAGEDARVAPLARTTAYGCVLTFLERNKEVALKTFRDVVNNNLEMHKR